MGTPIKLGENVLFFPKASYTGGKVAGFTNVDACVVCTKSTIYVVPKKDFRSFAVVSVIRSYNYFPEGVSVEDGLRNLVSNKDMDVETLDETLSNMLDATNHDRVIRIADLKSFKIILMWILSQARMSHKAGGAPKTLAPRGKGAVKAMKEFYGV